MYQMIDHWMRYEADMESFVLGFIFGLVFTIVSLLFIAPKRG